MNNEKCCVAAELSKIDRHRSVTTPKMQALCIGADPSRHRRHASNKRLLLSIPPKPPKTLSQDLPPPPVNVVFPNSANSPIRDTSPSAPLAQHASRSPLPCPSQSHI